jgi:glycosyltransferase involved in cell wall biosynthesis
MRICVILPTLNEEEGITEIINDIPNPLVNKIIVVDGYSSDRTVELVKQCHKPACDIELKYQQGKGKGMAFQSFLNSFDLNSQDVYVMLDADCTYDPKEIRSMVEPIVNDEADVVMGNRFESENLKEIMPFTTFLGNKLLTFFSKILYFKDPKDVCTGYWAFSRDFIKKIRIKAKDFDLEANLFTEAVKHGFRIKPVTINYRKRVGKNKLRKYHAFVIISRLIKEIFR